jgi:Mg-chelatase subunit ChlD
MQTFSKWTFAALALVAGLLPAAVRAADEGVALAIVYDTSGSMKETVPDANQGFSPKYVIANRALQAVTRQLQAFRINSSGGTRRIDAGLFAFQGDAAREVVKFGPFDPAAFESWAKHFNTPHGNTPLGNAVVTAANAVLKSPLSRKHVLVITDGLNTAGPPPQAVLPQLKQTAERKGSSFSVHFVAFDVDARQFAPVKRLGATVVGAADEKQLNTQLQFILQQKILLEEEEPPKTH